MAINFPNFLGQTYKPDLSGVGDLVENIGKGYTIGRMPDTMREEQEGRMRENAIKAIQQKFAEPMAQAQLGLLGAQTEKARAPAALSGETAQLIGLRQKYPEGTEERRIIDQMIEKKTTGTAGMAFTVDPEGQVSFTQGGPATAGAPQSIAGYPTLEKGANYVFHPETKQPIGISSAPTPADVKEEAGRSFVNVIQPFMINSAGGYTGPGANANLAKDIYNAKLGDEESIEKVVNYLAAKKLTSAAAVKEMATIGSPTTQKVYSNLFSSMEEGDVNKKLDQFLKAYTIPAFIQQKASFKFNEMLNKAQSASKSSVPARNIRYFNPQTPLDKSHEATGDEIANKTDVGPGKKRVFKSQADFDKFYLSRTPKQKLELEAEYHEERVS